jgi:hypothetical protein
MFRLGAAAGIGDLPEVLSLPKFLLRRNIGFCRLGHYRLQRIAAIPIMPR